MGREAVAQWFERQYVEWRARQSDRKAGITQFAEWLDIPRGHLTNYMTRGSMPTGENLEKIAAKLGPEIYDVLDLPRPDPRLQSLIESWGTFSEDVISELFDVLARYRPGEAGGNVADDDG